MTRVKIEGRCSIVRAWDDGHSVERITPTTADLFLAPRRVIFLEEADGMTTRVRLEAQHGIVEVRERQADARLGTTTVATHTIQDGSHLELHLWDDHWLEVREVP